jgi:hypothetical protein
LRSQESAGHAEVIDKAYGMSGFFPETKRLQVGPVGSTTPQSLPELAIGPEGAGCRMSHSASNDKTGR